MRHQGDLARQIQAAQPRLSSFLKVEATTWARKQVRLGGLTHARRRARNSDD